MVERDQFAGFWRRVIALIIDWNLVLIALFPFIILGGLFYPEKVLVEVPYGLFTEEKVLESTRETLDHRNGSVTVIEESIVEQTVFGRWQYLYLQSDERIANHTETSRELIDLRTREPIELIDADSFLLIILMVYWTLSETSRHRASIGKRVMNIVVLDENGNRLTWRRSLWRNLGKFLSAFVFMVGFMMAGWTNRKQALHDMLAKCLVCNR